MLNNDISSEYVPNKSKLSITVVRFTRNVVCIKHIINMVRKYIKKTSIINSL